MQALVVCLDDAAAVRKIERDDYSICLGCALPLPFAKIVTSTDGLKVRTFLESLAAGRPVFDFPLEVRLDPRRTLRFAAARAGNVSLMLAADDRDALLVLVDKIASGAREADSLAALAAMREEAEHQAQHSAQFVDELAGANDELLRLLVDSRQPLRGIFDSTFQFTWLLDKSGRVLTANTTAIDFSGAAGEPSGKPFWASPGLRLSADARRALEHVIQQGAAGRFGRCELPLMLDDRAGVVEWSIKPVVDPWGHVSLIVLEGRDLTALRSAQETARNAERLAALGSVAAGIAHEINNPISAAWTAAEVALTARRKPHGDRLIDECLATIVDSVKRCDQIVQSVLRIARNEPSEKSPQHLNELARRTCETAKTRAASAGVNLQTRLDDSLALALGNALDIERALLNLVHNAIDASSAGDCVAVTTLNDRSVVKIIVQDQGCGIPQDERQRIFDPFFTARRDSSGTGLGLTLAHKIVQEHGGTLSVESEIDRGSSFTIELPAIDCHARENFAGNVARARQ